MGNVLTGLIVITEENRNSSSQSAGSTAGLPTGQYARITDIKNFEAGKKLKDVIIEGEGLNNVSEISFNSNEIKGTVNSSNTKITFTDTTDIPENNVSLKVTYTNKRGITETKTYSFDLSFKPNTITIDSNGNFVVTTTDSKIVYIFKPIYSDNNESINEYEQVTKITLDEIPNTVKSIGNNIYIFTKTSIYTYDNNYEQKESIKHNYNTYFVASDSTKYYLIDNNLFVRLVNTDFRQTTPEGYSGVINQVVENDNIIIIIDSKYNVFIYNKIDFLTEPNVSPNKSYNSGKIDSLLPITIKTVFPNYTGKDFDVHVVTTGNTVKLIKPNYTTKKFEVLHDFSSSDGVSFSSPKGLVLDPKTGNAILCDSENNGFKEIDFGSVDAVWTQMGSDIVGAATGDRSGWRVSLSSDGKIVAIGAPFSDSSKGHVRVYEYNNGSWSKLGSDIPGATAGDQSGWSVSLSSDGKIVAIGAPWHDHRASGHVRVYQYTEANGWSKLGNDIDGEATANDNSGYSVSLSSDGKIVAIGASWIGYKGCVRIYQYKEYANGNVWTKLGDDILGEAEYDQSGCSVSLSSDGKIVAIGARYNGHVRVYEYTDEDGDGIGSWKQLGDDIDVEAAGDESGRSVSLSSDGKIVAIGVSGIDSLKGHVRVYEYNNGSWSKLGSDIPGAATGDRSGWSVSLSSNGKIVAIGAPYNDNGNDEDIGHVRVFEYTEADGWAQLGLDIPGEEKKDQSGYSVSLSSDGKIVAIGAPYNDGENGAKSDSGRVRVYSLIDNTLNIKPYCIASDELDTEYVAATDNTNNLVIFYRVIREQKSTRLEEILTYKMDDDNVAFNNPTGITFSTDKFIYVCDNGNKRIVVLKVNHEEDSDSKSIEYHKSYQNDNLTDLKDIYYYNNRLFFTNGNDILMSEISILNSIVTISNHTKINLLDISDQPLSLSNPIGISINTSDDMVVTTGNYLNFFKFNTDFSTATLISSYGDENGGDENDKFKNPTYLDIRNNFIAVNDKGNNRIKLLRFDNHTKSISFIKHIERSVDTNGLIIDFTNGSLHAPDNIEHNELVEIVDIKFNQKDNTYLIAERYRLNIVKPVYNDCEDGIISLAHLDYFDTVILNNNFINVITNINIHEVNESTYILLLTISELNVLKLEKENDNYTFKHVGSYGTEIGNSFSFATNLAIHVSDQSTYYVITEFFGNRIKVIKATYASDGNSVSFELTANYGEFGSSENQFNYPICTVVYENDQNGNVYYITSDTVNNRLKVTNVSFDNNGDMVFTHVKHFGSEGYGPLEFNGINTMVLSVDSILVGDNYNNRLKQINIVNTDDGIDFIPIKHIGNVSTTSTPAFDINGPINCRYFTGDPTIQKLLCVDILNYTNIKTVEIINNGVWLPLGGDIPGGAAGYSFSLSSDGNIVATGDPYNDSFRGQVRVFEYKDNVWTQLGGDIDGAAADDWSGNSVSLSSDGKIVAIGAPNNDGTTNNNIYDNRGHVRVFEYTEAEVWTQLGGDINGAAQNDESGWSVSLSSDGKIVAIGAPNNIDDNSGRVRVYQYTEDVNGWTQLGGDIIGAVEGDQSGSSVSLSSDGKIVAIGVDYTTFNKDNRGYVRVYQYIDNGDGTGSWAQLGLDILGAATGDESKWSVSLSDDGKIVAIGADLIKNINGGIADYIYGGNIRVYEYIEDDVNGIGSWTQLGSDISDVSGGSVSLSGDGKTIFISDSYVYKLVGAETTEPKWCKLGQGMLLKSSNISKDGSTICGDSILSNNIQVHRYVNPLGEINKLTVNNVTGFKVGDVLSGNSIVVTGETLDLVTSIDYVSGDTSTPFNTITTNQDNTIITITTTGNNTVPKYGDKLRINYTSFGTDSTYEVDVLPPTDSPVPTTPVTGFVTNTTFNANDAITITGEKLINVYSVTYSTQQTEIDLSIEAQSINSLTVKFSSEVTTEVGDKLVLKWGEINNLQSVEIDISSISIPSFVLNEVFPPLGSFEVRSTGIDLTGLTDLVFNISVVSYSINGGPFIIDTINSNSVTINSNITDSQDQITITNPDHIITVTVSGTVYEVKPIQQ